MTIEAQFAQLKQQRHRVVVLTLWDTDSVYEEVAEIGPRIFFYDRDWYLRGHLAA